MNRKGFAPLIVIGIVAIVLIAGVAGYFVWKQSSRSGSELSARISGPGGGCGGSVANPYVCQTGYHCAVNAAVNPFGGTCVSDSTSTSIDHPDQVILSTSTVQNTTTVSLGIPFKGYQLTLYAPDQAVSKVENAFCGAPTEGAAMSNGTYKIIISKGTSTLSALSLGQMEFVAGTPHDGLHAVTFTPTGDQFIEINEYGSCNGDFSSFYTLNSKNQLVNVPFIRNGTSTAWIYSGWIDPNAPIDGTFCGYDNAAGYDFCDTYQYKNYSFIRMDAWVTQELASTTATDVGRAKRYLFDLGDSSKIKPYIPSDAQYVDEIDEIQTSTLPYKFQVDFTNSSITDYQYIFEVSKTQNGFQAVLPPTNVGSSIQTWKTYHNSTYGFSIKYSSDQPTPQIYNNSASSIDYDPVVEENFWLFFNDFSAPFQNSIYDSSIDNNDSLTYSTSTQQWIVTAASSSSNPVCPQEKETIQQGLPYYVVQTGIHAGESFDAYITDKGIIVVAGGDYFANDKFWPDQVSFDNPGSVTKATCRVIKK